MIVGAINDIRIKLLTVDKLPEISFIN